MQSVFAYDVYTLKNIELLKFSLIKKKVRAPFVGPKSKKFPDGLKVSKLFELFYFDKIHFS